MTREEIKTELDSIAQAMALYQQIIDITPDGPGKDFVQKQLDAVRLRHAKQVVRFYGE